MHEHRRGWDGSVTLVKRMGDLKYGTLNETLRLKKMQSMTSTCLSWKVLYGIYHSPEHSKKSKDVSLPRLLLVSIMLHC